MGSLRQDITYPSKVNGRTIRGYIFRPEGGAKAAVMIIHGMREYFLRYEGLINFLCDNGFIVFGNDHLGHGQEAMDTHTLGYITDRKGFDPLERDAYTMFNMVKQENPHIPFFIFGHSMGSFIARIFATRHKGEYSGLILSGTASENPLSSLAGPLCYIVGTFCGDKKQSKFLNDIFFMGYNRKVESPVSPSDWLSRDREVVDAYDKDPLCSFYFTPPAYKALSDLLSYCNHPVWFDSMPKDVPIRFISGDMDPVGNYGKGVTRVFKKLSKRGAKNIEIYLYEGGRHEMHNEINRLDVYKDILSMLDSMII